MTQQLPANEEAEAGIIARLLLDPVQLPVLADRLSAEDFYVPAFRDAYRKMQDLSAAHRAIDLIALGDAGRDLSRLVTDLTPAHRATLDEYAALVRDAAFRRRMIGTLDRLTRQAYESDDRNGLLSALSEATSTIMAGVEEGNLLTMAQAVDAYERALEQGGRHGLRYGFHSLDELIQPARGGDMIVLAARPSVGKTALAERIADHWAGVGPHPVLFASIEMSVSQLLDRAVARRGEIDPGRIVRGLLNDQEMELARVALEERRSVSVWYLDDPFATTASVRAAAAKVKLLAGGVSGIVIDYLQLLKDPGDTEVSRVTRISRQVKAIAREFDVPLLVLSQLNRNVEQREDPHPRLHDLRESGAIEQDADLVIGLYRQLGTLDLDLDVLKNRQGQLGRIPMTFDPTRVTFNDVDKLMREAIR